MPEFIPLTMLKDAIGIVEFCQDCGEPVFVTRNGIPEMVIMDSEFSIYISGIVRRMAGWILSESTQEFQKPL